MMLTRVNPFGEMLRFDPLHRWLDWSVPYLRVDVLEHDASYEIRADLPGARREDIKVDVNGNEVDIAAEFNAGEEVNNGAVRTERLHGRFRRRLTLGQDVDAGKASSVYKDGVLTITLPKSRTVKRTQVAVH